jgi:heat shock protein HtpX
MLASTTSEAERQPVKVELLIRRRPIAVLIFESQREARGRTLRLLLAFAAHGAAAGAGGQRGAGTGLGPDLELLGARRRVPALLLRGQHRRDPAVRAGRLVGGNLAPDRRRGGRWPSRWARAWCSRAAISTSSALPTSSTRWRFRLGHEAAAAMVLARDMGINAFATGWDERRCGGGRDPGALDHLSRDELQGLVAHEFSHIREGDTRLNMRLVGMVFGLEMLFRMGQDLAEPDIASAAPWQRCWVWPSWAPAGWAGWPATRCRRRCRASASSWPMRGGAVDAQPRRPGRRVAQGDGPAARGRGIPPHRLDGAAHAAGGHRGWAVAHWFDSHPPLEERMRRIYGRRMGPLPKPSPVGTP